MPRVPGRRSQPAAESRVWLAAAPLPGPAGAAEARVRPHAPAPRDGLARRPRTGQKARHPPPGPLSPSSPLPPYRPPTPVEHRRRWGGSEGCRPGVARGTRALPGGTRALPGAAGPHRLVIGGRMRTANPAAAPRPSVPGNGYLCKYVKLSPGPAGRWAYGRGHLPSYSDAMPQTPRRSASAESAVHTPQTLLAHVRALTPNLAPAEQRVAAAVVNDPGGVAAKTISELAEACQTSGTTVIRFCRAMGF